MAHGEATDLLGPSDASGLAALRAILDFGADAGHRNPFEAAWMGQYRNGMRR